jgi:hypothetical protein
MPPIFKNKSQIDKFSFFQRDAFEYSNANTLRGLYKAIEDARENHFGDTAFASIYFKAVGDEENNKVRTISFKADDLTSYTKFKQQYDRIASGNWVGSDAINKEEITPILTNFSLSATNIAKSGSSKSDSNIFITAGIEETKRKVGKKTIGNKDCSKLCLEYIAKKLGVDIIVEEDLSSVSKLIDFIKFHNLPISIIANSFTLIRSNKNIVKDTIIPIKDKKGNITKYECGKPVMGLDVQKVYFFENKEEKAVIVLDEINEHYDVLEKLEFADDVFISASSKVIKAGKIIFTPREVNINSHSKIKVEKRFLFFDYETVIDFNNSNCMQEYSLSFLNLSNEELEELTQADINNDYETVKKIRENCCVTFLGYDCSNKFIDWLVKNQEDILYTFIGFNNTNFDNFILLSALLKYKNIDVEIPVDSVFYNGSQLLNFHVFGRHQTFDIRKHLIGSLKANCESFKINCCAKKSFDHNKAQQLFLDGGLIDFIEGNEELREYNEYDVLATAVLFCKYRRALKENESTKKFANELDTIKTIGSLIYKVFEENKTKKGFNLPKLNFKQYTDLQKFKIAGRVELFNGVQKVEVRLVSTDVCSLYPYVMSVCNVFYPCGEIVETEEFKGIDALGFYYCDIDQSNLKEADLPNIYAKKTAIENDWSTTEVLEDYLISNVTIGLLLKFGCKVVIKNGFYFTEKKKSCDMFDFLLDSMAEKNKQDSLKKDKKPSYNPALRETLKLLMNSLSGKVIEGLHTEKTKDVGSIADYINLQKNSKAINFINTIGNKIFVTYEVEEEKLINKQRPIYLGVYIYDYAKRYMYENSYSKVGLKELLYTDTDASKFRYSKFLEWKKEIDDKNIVVPHWEEVEKYDERYKTHRVYQSDSKVFGSFEDELEDAIGEKYTFYCVEKKSWCYTVDGKSKFRFKGLNGSAIGVDFTESFIEKVVINKQDGSKEIKYRFKADSKLEVYNYCENNKHKSIEESGADEFFEKLYTEREAYVICCSFRKIVKNSKRGVEVGETDRYNQFMNKIQVSHTLKKISLK